MRRSTLALVLAASAINAFAILRGCAGLHARRRCNALGYPSYGTRDGRAVCLIAVDGREVVVPLTENAPRASEIRR